MTDALPCWTAGLASVANGSRNVTIAGGGLLALDAVTGLTRAVARKGDRFIVDGVGEMLITAVADAEHVTLVAPWPFAAQANAAYEIMRVSIPASGELAAAVAAVQRAGSALAPDVSRTFDGGPGGSRCKVDVSGASPRLRAGAHGAADAALLTAIAFDAASGRASFPSGAEFPPHLVLPTAGTPAAYTFTPPAGGAPDGALFALQPHATSRTALDAAPTLRADGIDAAPRLLLLADGTIPRQGMLRAGGIYLVTRTAADYRFQPRSSPDDWANLLESGGRSAERPESIYYTAGAWSYDGAFSPYNGAAMAAGAKKTHGGWAGADANVAAPWNKISSSADVKNYGLEHYLTQVAAGAGTVLPQALGGVARYPFTFNPTGFGVPLLVTTSVYAKVVSGSLTSWRYASSTMCHIDGIDQNFAANASSPAFAAADAGSISSGSPRRPGAG